MTTGSSVDRDALDGSSDRYAQREQEVHFDTAVWIGLPSVIGGIALPQILGGAIGVAVGVAFGAIAVYVFRDHLRTLRFRPSRTLFYGGLLFVGAPALRPIAGETVADWMFAAALACLIAELILKRRVPRRMPPPLLIAGGTLVAFSALVAASFSDTPASAIGAGARFLLVTVVWTWLAVLVLERREHVYLSILAWAMSAAASSIAAVAQLLGGDVIPGTSPVWGRMTGFGQHVNELGAIAGIALIPTACLAIATRGRDRYLTATLGAAAIVGLALSGSVTNVIGVVVGGAVAALLAGRPLLRVVTQPRFVAAAAVAVVLFAAAGSLAVASGRMDSPWERLTRTTNVNPQGEVEEDRATLLQRFDTFRVGWERIREHPFVGAGMNPDSLGLAGETFVHNTVLGTWAGLGPVAAIGLLLCLIAPFVAAASLLRQKQQSRPLVIGLIGGAIAFTVYAAAAPALYRRFGWVPTLLLATLAARPFHAWQRLSSTPPRMDRPDPTKEQPGKSEHAPRGTPRPSGPMG